MPDSTFCRKCGTKRDMTLKPDRFGFANVPSADGRTLQITWIDPSGVLGRWNRMHPEKLVREGDFIVAVNNFLGDIEAMRTTLQLDSVRMLVKDGKGAPVADAGLGGFQPAVGGDAMRGGDDPAVSLRSAMAVMQANGMNGINGAGAKLMPEQFAYGQSLLQR